MSASDGLRLECVSSQSEEGMITGRDGNTIPLGEAGVWRLTNPFNRPGVLRLLTHSTQSPITATNQAYTLALFLAVMAVKLSSMLDYIPVVSTVSYMYILCM